MDCYLPDLGDSGGFLKPTARFAMNWKLCLCAAEGAAGADWLL